MKQRYLILVIIVFGLIVFLVDRSQPKITSGIKGVVRLGPTCPLTKENRNDPACRDELYRTDLELVDFESFEVVKKFISNSDGTFSISVLPGEYTIRSVKLRNGFPECGKSGLVPVETDEYTEVIVFCDTGIR